MVKSTFYFLTALIVVSANIAWAFPEPAVVQGKNEWTLDVAFDHPQQIAVKVPGSAKRQNFWFTILTLTNNSNSDVPFYPSCDLVTDTFKVVSAGTKTQQLVFAKIKNLYEGKYPFLELIDFANHKILQGQDNSIDIAIIWKDFDKDAKSVDLFIAGLSNETVVLDHPTKKDDNGNPVKIYLRKTLDLKYTIGGDKALRSTAGMLFKDKSWVMR
jgi:hypothetical protein